LSDLLAGRGSDMELDRAALRLATIEYPELEIESALQTLDSYAAELGARTAGADGEIFVKLAKEYLFQELGFQGNTADYYSPGNSCLNEVLSSRTGIPITLSAVYMEIARRLGRPVYGISMPGHFLVQYNDGLYSTFIDPFHRGQLLHFGDCCELAKTAAGVDLRGNPTLLAPVATRQIVHRMINNLRGIYFSRRAYRKALAVLNLLIEANPSSPEEHKQRGLLHLQLDRARAAKADLERYLQMAPQATDRAAVEAQLASLRRLLAGLN
ncbi:MAG: transglutaminase-like domain-containing protein, partial [Bryobacteraceae bacterium]